MRPNQMPRIHPHCDHCGCSVKAKVNQHRHSCYTCRTGRCGYHDMDLDSHNCAQMQIDEIDNEMIANAL